MTENTLMGSVNCEWYEARYRPIDIEWYVARYKPIDIEWYEARYRPIDIEWYEARYRPIDIEWYEARYRPIDIEWYEARYRPIDIEWYEARYRPIDIEWYRARYRPIDIEWYEARYRPIDIEWYKARYRPIGGVSNIAAVQTFVCPRWPLCVSREKFKGERVPTLQEAVEECINHQLTIFFDVKDQPDKMRQANPGVVTALTHRPWSLSRYGDGTPRSLSAWTNYWLGVLDVLLDWAHHHLLWNLCGVSAILMQKDFISLSPLPSSIPLYRDYVQYWAERGVEVVGWTINTAVDKQYYQDVLKISYITDSLREDCEPHY
ncbi:uncharacterized protein LOC110487023 isoform X5 [Oncorhynchus mykiss]|uniref:uncharacterized protein LOC110487023 isoform X5 n=1 Tax=Oncorhynchus mykiss TaxID=8022 RepID=UPI0018781B0A|nr:uncharacterized protein LOC110487023 isoform X5 [Oncorhynchus mykiss]